MSVRKTRSASQWIQQHQPNRRERRFLARAIVASSGQGSVAEGPFGVVRFGARFTFEGPHSILITSAREEIDKIMAAIAWADAFEDYLDEDGRTASV